MTEKQEYNQRNINLKTEIIELVENEIERRRNGERGFSLTVNQMLEEWLDGYNAGLLPLDRRELQEMPAVERLMPVSVETGAV